jgi:cytosine/adenosine deaminase-related metal-dependent hydrolase
MADAPKTLIRGGVIVTCDGADRVVEGDVAIRGRVIAGVGPTAAATLEPPYSIVDAAGSVVMPGLVQAHIHLVQTLFRGLADDVPLLAWLKRFIWPLEAAHDDASLAVSAELGVAELLLGGTTTILDMGTVHGHDVVFEVLARSGLRALSGKAMMDTGADVPKGLRETTRASLRESDRLASAWSGAADGRLGYAYCPRFILSCSEALLRECALAARARGAIVHTHAAEQEEERAAVRQERGGDDIALLASYGVTGARAVLAHGVQLRADEMARLAAEETRVVHCPSSNLKLGSGIAAVHALRAAGVVVGLGADGAPCNNNLDGWLEMRLAALLAKVRSGTTTLPAREVLRMATIDGARALGLDREVGSLEVGKRADVIVVGTSELHAAPAVDPRSTLVYAVKASDVRHVFVDGHHVVKHRELLTLDAPRVAGVAREHATRISRRAGL